MDKEIVVVVILIIMVLVVTVGLIGSQIGLTGLIIGDGDDSESASSGLRVGEEEDKTENKPADMIKLDAEEEETFTSSSSSGGGGNNGGGSNSGGGNNPPVVDTPEDPVETYEVDFAVSSYSGKENDEFTINVEISSSEGIYAAEFTLSFNPDILEVLSVDEGNFLNKDGTETYKVVKEEDGEILFGLIRVGQVREVSGEGNLAEIKFKAKAVGESDLILENIMITDTTPEVGEFIANIQNSKVTIS